MKTRLMGTILTVLILTTSLVFAAHRPQHKAKPVRRPRPGAFMRMRQFDTNGDLYISKAEFQKVFDDDLAATRDAYAKILSLFDTNGDGKLDGKELMQARKFIWTLFGAQRFDLNRDFVITPQEEDKSWNNLMELARQYNQFMLDHFDKNHDGKLSPAEVAAGRRALARRGRRGG